jgi:hypothetical protein
VKLDAGYGARYPALLGATRAWVDPTNNGPSAIVKADTLPLILYSEVMLRQRFRPVHLPDDTKCQSRQFAEGYTAHCSKMR